MGTDFASSELIELDQPGAHFARIVLACAGVRPTEGINHDGLDSAGAQLLCQLLAVLARGEWVAATSEVDEIEPVRWHPDVGGPPCELGGADFEVEERDIAAEWPGLKLA